jgi:flagellar hook protein FlgE
MSFQQGLSGLNAASRNLEVIGNNVANTSTIGFKTSRAEFADVYATSIAGATSNQSGIGVTVSDVAQQFQQGNLSITNNPLDVAVNGTGFFRLSKQGSIVYTRNGQFQIDKDGYITNSAGDRATGYPANAAGLILQSSIPAEIRVDTADQSPQVTSQAILTANLDSRRAVLPPAGFNFNDPTTYHNTTTIQIFDTLGNSHNLSLFFLKNAANSWQVYAQNDGAALNGGAPVGTVNFSSAGTIDTATTTLPFALSVPMAGGATTPQAVNLDFTGTTQFGANFGVTRVNQDGYTSGRLLGFTMSNDGVILGRYSNGQSRAQGQIVLASFTNTQGLQPLGGNQWAESSASGQPAIGVPNTGNRGVLQAGALEESNVDLTAELVNMITAQRVYQANAQTIRTQDALLQTLVTIR